MNELIQILIDRYITGYATHKVTGIRQYVISELRTGKSNLNNLSLN
ncbi:hypothetical protein P3U32_00380 [Mammaliicoccus sp. Dog046]|nr:hypothetical protein [Mammaliicoccus sp. Dog046]WQK85523.1 hypothetical protein P3U32_00380 [Mammaliicoccus sp. Dog046]